VEVQPPLSSCRHVSGSAQRTHTGTRAGFWQQGSFSQKMMPAVVPLLWHCHGLTPASNEALHSHLLTPPPQWDVEENGGKRSKTHGLG